MFQFLGRHRAALALCAVIILAVFIGGCSTPGFVQADQDRKNFVYGPNGMAASHVQLHPEQAQTVRNFGDGWQMDIDANKNGYKPWWLGGNKPAPAPTPAPGTGTE